MRRNRPSSDNWPASRWWHRAGVFPKATGVPLTGRTHMTGRQPTPIGMVTASSFQYLPVRFLVPSLTSSERQGVVGGAVVGQAEGGKDDTRRTQGRPGY